MTTEKPNTLIGLLNTLKTETDKTKYQSIYIDIAKEVMSLEFEHNPKQPLEGILYKKLVQLSVKEFVYSGQTEESLSNLNEVIDILSYTSVLVR
ncbi:hypothetical protein [Flavobacterium succinicans]|uniref:Uncharacterized protein n=1 Tax=Flavobacterium succinicans TaxID=29536 RepID=A0A199XT46_9FLAO|nr:hypothetical protein [Flavobacterium succinicans]OAZ04504.1 hypothetical protein FLB_10990 [Flavobacterium succinicans]